MGFDPECVLHPETVPGGYYCPLCRQLAHLVDVQQTQCGHLFCRPCVLYILGTTRCCPYENHPINEADPKNLQETNPAVYESLGQIGVRCLFHKSGCVWQGKLCDSDAHSSSCGYGSSPVFCNRCGVQMLHRQVQEHAHTCTGTMLEAQSQPQPQLQPQPQPQYEPHAQAQLPHTVQDTSGGNTANQDNNQLVQGGTRGAPTYHGGQGQPGPGAQVQQSPAVQALQNSSNGQGQPQVHQPAVRQQGAPSSGPFYHQTNHQQQYEQQQYVQHQQYQQQQQFQLQQPHIFEQQVPGAPPHQILQATQPYPQQEPAQQPVHHHDIAQPQAQHPHPHPQQPHPLSTHHQQPQPHALVHAHANPPAHPLPQTHPHPHPQHSRPQLPHPQLQADPQHFYPQPHALLQQPHQQQAPVQPHLQHPHPHHSHPHPTQPFPLHSQRPHQQSLHLHQPPLQPLHSQQLHQQSPHPLQPHPQQPHQQILHPHQPHLQLLHSQQAHQQSFNPQQPNQQTYPQQPRQQNPVNQQPHSQPALQPQAHHPPTQPWQVQHQVAPLQSQQNIPANNPLPKAQLCEKPQQIQQMGCTQDGNTVGQVQVLQNRNGYPQNAGLQQVHQQSQLHQSIVQRQEKSLAASTQTQPGPHVVQLAPKIADLEKSNQPIQPPMQAVHHGASDSLAVEPGQGDQLSKFRSAPVQRSNGFAQNDHVELDQDAEKDNVEHEPCKPSQQLSPQVQQDNKISQAPQALGSKEPGKASDSAATETVPSESQEKTGDQQVAERASTEVEPSLSESEPPVPKVGTTAEHASASTSENKEEAPSSTDGDKKHIEDVSEDKQQSPQQSQQHPQSQSSEINAMQLQPESPRQDLSQEEQKSPGQNLLSLHNQSPHQDPSLGPQMQEPNLASLPPMAGLPMPRGVIKLHQGGTLVPPFPKFPNYSGPKPVLAESMLRVPSPHFNGGSTQLSGQGGPAAQQQSFTQVLNDHQRHDGFGMALNSLMARPSALTPSGMSGIPQNGASELPNSAFLPPLSMGGVRPTSIDHNRVFIENVAFQDAKRHEKFTPDAGIQVNSHQTSMIRSEPLRQCPNDIHITPPMAPSDILSQFPPSSSATPLDLPLRVLSHHPMCASVEGGIRGSIPSEVAVAQEFPPERPGVPPRPPTYSFHATEVGVRRRLLSEVAAGQEFPSEIGLHYGKPGNRPIVPRDPELCSNVFPDIDAHLKYPSDNVHHGPPTIGLKSGRLVDIGLRYTPPRESGSQQRPFQLDRDPRSRFPLDIEARPSFYLDGDLGPRHASDIEPGPQSQWDMDSRPKFPSGLGPQHPFQMDGVSGTRLSADIERDSGLPLDLQWRPQFPSGRDLTRNSLLLEARSHPRFSLDWDAQTGNIISHPDFMSGRSERLVPHTQPLGRRVELTGSRLDAVTSCCSPGRDPPSLILTRESRLPSGRRDPIGLLGDHNFQHGGRPARLGQDIGRELSLYRNKLPHDSLNAGTQIHHGGLAHQMLGPGPGSAHMPSSFRPHGPPRGLFNGDLFFESGPLINDAEPFDSGRKRKQVGSSAWCRICHIDCYSVEGLEEHLKTEEHRKNTLDLVMNIKEESAKKQRLSR